MFCDADTDTDVTEQVGAEWSGQTMRGTLPPFFPVSFCRFPFCLVAVIITFVTRTAHFIGSQWVQIPRHGDPIKCAVIITFVTRTGVT
jgi:hypothetical protein